MVGSYNFKDLEENARKRWINIKLLEKLQKKNSNGKPYFLLDGPPYANNIPHIGHIRNTVYKDFYIRCAFMQGKSVFFQPGFDTHGLPIENMVEKKLNLKSKKDIKKLGIKKFCDTCKDNATHYKDVWIRIYDKMGSWYSWKEPYLTYTNEYLESVWWSFKKLWDKDMVYEGKKPVFWCPKCETALAGYEATDKYTDVQDPLIIVKFRIKDTQNDYLLVFTTTPWTLPANVALAVKGDEVYVKAKTSKGNFVLAKNLISLLEEIKVKYEIVEEFKGSKLDGLEYESLLDLPAQKELQKNKNALKVYLSIPILKERITSKVMMKKGLTSAGDVFGEFVSVEEGTGIVHMAPGHGKMDNLVGKHYGLPVVSPLDDQCKFTKDAGKYEGKFVKDADKDILEDLEKGGKLLYSAKLTHSYPLCWRCSSPLIFRLSNQWFLKTDMIKDKMLKFNEHVEWQPDFAEERFTNWVVNAEDWNFSRQRFWGTPIPIWKSEDGEYKVVGSKGELEKELGKKLPANFDLHTISELKLKSKTGKEMKTIGDIFDVWFDSGCAPFAAFHYPFENKELFEMHYPVDRINESQDQIRGWFYSLMFCGVATFGKAPYKTVSMPGWVVDKLGEKMSKSLGNFISAEQAIDDLGADNVRFYYCSDIDPSSLSKFNMDTVKQEAGKIHSTLWNLHNLLITQVKASDEKCDLSNDVSKLKLQVEDKWILSRLTSVIDEVKKFYDEFKLHFAGRAMSDFILNDLSRTYVQLVRERLENDTAPLKLIHYCIVQISRLLAPVSPHVTDEIYINLKNELSVKGMQESVHLELLPGITTDETKQLKGLKNKKLEENFENILDVIGAILAARDSAKIGIRWPVREVIVETSDSNVKTAVIKLESVILKFVNAKSIVLKKGPSRMELKTNFRNLGKEFGQETGDVAALLKKNEVQIKEKLVSGETSFKIDKYQIKKDFFDIKILPEEGYSLGEFKLGKAFIKSTLDESLMPEGYAREVMRRVQVLRKDMGLKKQDKIDLCIETEFNDLITRFENEIKNKVGAKTISFEQKLGKKFSSSSEDKIKGKVVKLFANKI